LVNLESMDSDEFWHGARVWVLPICVCRPNQAWFRGGDFACANSDDREFERPTLRDRVNRDDFVSFDISNARVELKVGRLIDGNQDSC
jgi:hypothetical protein